MKDAQRDEEKQPPDHDQAAAPNEVLVHHEDAGKVLGNDLLTLWLTDRSRYLLGLAHCQYHRYLHYHSGENGYGITRRAESMPLATGSSVHEVLANLVRYPRDAVTRDVVRTYIRQAVHDYNVLLAKRGFADLEPGSSQDFVRMEQSSLIEALSWGWYRTAFDYFHDNWLVVRVEQEETYVIHCDCGLGDGVGEPADHVARGCLHPKVIMSRPDFIARRKDTGSLGNADWKTSAYEPYVEDWQDSVQMAFGGLGAERSLGEELAHYDLHFLLKGQRKRDKDEDTGDFTGPKRQQTALIYGWKREAVPPMLEEDWKPSYWYYDQTPSKWQVNKEPGPLGFRHSLGKTYRQRPVWERILEDGSSPIEHWVMDELPEEIVRDSFRILGPFQRPAALMRDVIPQVIAEEQETIEKLWRIQDGEDPRHLFRQSWNCNPYGKDHPCPMKPICFNPLVAADPIQSGLYVPRRPHHALELDQMRQRGLEIPEDSLTEDDE